MSIFQKLDNQFLGDEIRKAQARVVLCIPGFDDHVASAVIRAWRQLGPDNVNIILDASAHTARLGYGHFDAVKLLSSEGVQIRIEPGIRLGVAIIDKQGWCFAAPPLLVDATMEQATAPNAIQLSESQIALVLSAMPQGTTSSPPQDAGSSDTASTASSRRAAESGTPEIGKQVLTPDIVTTIDESLDASPPQKFDLARKVNVFNAHLEFVELKLTGVQIGKHKTTLPNELLLAISDRDTREKINAQFRLIGDSAEILKLAGRLRERADDIRKTHTRTLPKFGAVILRKEKPKLDAEFEKLEAAVKDFSQKVKNDLADELAKSRNELVRALLPSLRMSPPGILQAEVDGPVTDNVLHTWISDQLDRVFPSAGELVTQMEATLTYKAITYETLTNNEFRNAATAAFPYGNLKKPLEEFVAAKAAN